MSRLALLAPVLTLTLVLASWSTSAATAQEACVEGRVRAPETEGRCCWPGQRWARDIRRCEGPPSCPGDLVADGDACVARSVSVTPAPEVAIPTPQAPTRPVTPRITPLLPGGASAPTHGDGVRGAARPSLSVASPAEWPIAPSQGPAGLRNPRLEVADFDEGLVIAGVTVFALGYIEQLFMAGLSFGSEETTVEYRHRPDDVRSGDPRDFGAHRLGYAYDIVDDASGRVAGRYDDYSCRDGIAGTLLIPVIGSIVAGALYSSCRLPHYYSSGSVFTLDHNHRTVLGEEAAGAIPGTVAQVVGLILFLVGITERPRSIRVSSAGVSLDVGAARLTLANSAPGADRGGAGLRLAF